MGLTKKAKQFLKKVEHERGRPLRVLFLGNIACNSYNNAKILRDRGVDTFVITPNDFFVMSHPAWENEEVEIKFEKSFSPNWKELGVTPDLPEWYVQGLMEPCINYMNHLMAGEKKEATSVRDSMEFYEQITTSPHPYEAEWQSFLANNDDYYQPSPKYFELWSDGQRPPDISKVLTSPVQKVRNKLRPANSLGQHLRSFVRWFRNNLAAFKQFIRSVASQKQSVKEYVALDDNFLPIEKIIEPSTYPNLRYWRGVYKRFFPSRRDPLQMADLTIWSTFALKWRTLFESVDVVIATATYGAIPLLSGYKNYFTYEHGTLRDIPFAEDGQGRVCSLTYALSKTTFVTNSDVLPQAEKLISDKSKIVCLPHAIDNEAIDSFSSENLKFEATDCLQLFAPARHDWAIKGNQMIIEAFGQLLANFANVNLLLVEWGAEIERTKKFIERLGLAHSVKWLLPSSKPVLRKYMRNSFVVLDQFELEAFGTTTVEALASSVPVITKINETEMIDFFGEAPPVINCASSDEIYKALMELVRNPKRRDALGFEGKKWISNFHSADLICSRQLEAIADAF